jgi:hypothetical protein
MACLVLLIATSARQEHEVVDEANGGERNGNH